MLDRLLWVGLGIVSAYTHQQALDIIEGGKGQHLFGFPSLEESKRILDDAIQWQPLFSGKYVVGLSVECRLIEAYWLGGSSLQGSQKLGNHQSPIGQLARSQYLQQEFYKSIAAEEADLLRECAQSLNGKTDGVATEFFRAFQLSRSLLDSVVPADGQSSNSTDHTGRDDGLGLARTLTNVPEDGSTAREIIDKQARKVRTIRDAGRRLPMERARNLQRLSSQRPPGRKSIALKRHNETAGILLTSLHHAREPTSLTVVLYSYLSLLRGLSRWHSGMTGYPYRKDQLGQQYALSEDNHALIASALLLNREILVVPFVNPDGYKAVQTSGRAYMRKNRRLTCHPLVRLAKASEKDGVDINRNYDFAFETKHNRCDSEEYEGPYPFSEPETRAIRRVAEIFKPSIALNFHSYGDVWTRPFNCCTNETLEPLADQIYDEIAEAIDITHMGSSLTLPQLGYPSTGEADDYLLGAHGIISMSPEVGPEAGEFYPPVFLRPAIDELNFMRTLSVISKAGSELTVASLPTRCLTSEGVTLSSVETGSEVDLNVTEARDDAVAEAEGAARRRMDGEERPIKLTSDSSPSWWSWFRSRNYECPYCNNASRYNRYRDADYNSRTWYDSGTWYPSAPRDESRPPPPYPVPESNTYRSYMPQPYYWGGYYERPKAYRPYGWAEGYGANYSLFQALSEGPEPRRHLEASWVQRIFQGPSHEGRQFLRHSREQKDLSEGFSVFVVNTGMQDTGPLFLTGRLVEHNVSVPKHEQLVPYSSPIGRAAKEDPGSIRSVYARMALETSDRSRRRGSKEGEYHTFYMGAGIKARDHIVLHLLDISAPKSVLELCGCYASKLEGSLHLKHVVRTNRCHCTSVRVADRGCKTHGTKTLRVARELPTDHPVYQLHPNEFEG